MRASALGSGLVHLAILVVLFVTRPPMSVIVPGPDVVQVSLLDPSAMPTAVVKPAVEEPKPEPTPVTPTEESGIKLAPPPKKQPPKRPPREEAPPETAGSTLPYTAVGNAGLRGQVSVDVNFEFAYYLSLVRNRVAQSWAPPAGLTTGGRPVRAIVYFRIARGGELSALRIETPSGYEFFDRSALRAIQLSDPMPPLPLGYGGGDLGVHFGFEFVAP